MAVRTLTAALGGTAAGLAGLFSAVALALTGALVAIDGVEFDTDDDPAPDRPTNPAVRAA